MNRVSDSCYIGEDLRISRTGTPQPTLGTPHGLWLLVHRCVSLSSAPPGICHPLGTLNDVKLWWQGKLPWASSQVRLQGPREWFDFPRSRYFKSIALTSDYTGSLNAFQRLLSMDALTLDRSQPEQLPCLWKQLGILAALVVTSHYENLIFVEHQLSLITFNKIFCFSAGLLYY